MKLRDLWGKGRLREYKAHFLELKGILKGKLKREVEETQRDHDRRTRCALFCKARENNGFFMTCSFEKKLRSKQSKLANSAHCERGWGFQTNSAKNVRCLFLLLFFPFLFVYHGFYGLLRQVGWTPILNLLFIFPETIPLDRLKSPCSPLNPLISLKLSPKKEMGKGPCTK